MSINVSATSSLRTEDLYLLLKCSISEIGWLFGTRTSFVLLKSTARIVGKQKDLTELVTKCLAEFMSLIFVVVAAEQFVLANLTSLLTQPFCLLGNL